MAASREHASVFARQYGTVTDGGPERGPEKTDSPTLRPWARAKAAMTTNRPTKSSTRNTPRFGVSTVLLPAEAARSPTVHKIHILGEDARSRFIAHALSGVYDSVQLLRSYGAEDMKYTNIETRDDPDNPVGKTSVVPNRIASSILATDDGNSRIDQLMLTGRGQTAALQMKQVRHRIDNDTTVCLLNDGLGVLEDVRRKILDPMSLDPNIVLGYMSHKIVPSRKHMSYREQHRGKLLLTQADQSRTDKTTFVETVRQAYDLRPSMETYDTWLRYKLPSVLFEAVSEPVCVAFDLTYKGVQANPSARAMMLTLLKELINVIRAFPEFTTNSTLRDWVETEDIYREFQAHLNARADAPSNMVRQVLYNNPTDIQFLNGYFLRRAKELGVPCFTNKHIMDVVKLKSSDRQLRNNTYIPMDEASVPSSAHARLRTIPPDQWAAIRDD